MLSPDISNCRSAHYPIFLDEWNVLGAKHQKPVRRATSSEASTISLSLEYSAGPTPIPKHVNTGDSDVSPDGIPSQFLLVRGLETSVTEEILAKGIAKLYKSSEANTGEPPKKAGAKVSSTTSSANLGAQEASIRRVFVVRDKDTDDSWRFGFTEFHGVEDAQAALVKFNSLDKFTIASKPVLLSYIHAGVFVPVSTASDEDKFSFSPAANPSLRLQYWDQLGYLREHVVSETPPGGRPALKAKPVDLAMTEGLVQDGKAGDGKVKKRKTDAGTTGPNKKVRVVAPTAVYPI
jgi:RNA recognition motif-containing protein